MGKNSILYFSLSIFTIGLQYLFNILLDFDNTLADSLSTQITEEQLYNYLNLRKDLEWIGYALSALILLLKILIIATILDVGCFFFGKEIKYKKLFNIVITAEFVFLLVIVFKAAWFYFFQTDYNLEDLQYFYPLSALSIIGYEGLQTWFIYPFQALNLFELVYWFILAYLIGKELNENTDKGFTIVASSYGLSLLIWVVGVMFFTLNIS